jgi:hypothetical protein
LRWQMQSLVAADCWWASRFTLKPRHIALSWQTQVRYVVQGCIDDHTSGMWPKGSTSA